MDFCSILHGLQIAEYSVENQDDLTDVIDAVVEDTNVPENTEETEVPKDDEETTTVGGSDTSAKLTEGWSSDSLQYVKDGAYVTNSFAEIDGQKYYFDENGNKVTGFKTIGADSYYFNESGMMQTGLQVLHDQETGIAVYSLRKEDGKLSIPLSEVHAICYRSPHNPLKKSIFFKS